MADIVEIERALAIVQKFDPLQRVLLTCTGTLQGTLSAWFGGPMKIVVIEQGQQGTLVVGETPLVDVMVFQRVIEMKHKGKCVMRADSTITTTRAEIENLIMERNLGLGQIMEKLGIRPEFNLLEADQDGDDFWRVYELLGHEVTYRIKEVFPQRLYRLRHG